MSLAGLVYARLRARLGYVGLLRTAHAAWVLAFILLGTSDQLAVIVLAPALFGLGMGIAVPSITVLTGEAAPLRLRGQVTALSGTAVFLGRSPPRCCSAR